MKESSPYQAALEEGRREGRVAEARRLLLFLGGVRFGLPDERTHAALARIDTLEILEGLCIRVLDVSSWQELLALP